MRRFGGTTVREELSGNFRELADELLRTASLSAKTDRTASIELCEFQGKPFTVRIDASAQSTRREETSFMLMVIVVGVVVLLVAVGGIALITVLMRKGGSAGKMLLQIGVPSLLLVTGMVVLTVWQSRRATIAEKRAVTAARVAMEEKLGFQSVTTPAIQRALAAWQQGDNSAAVSYFLAADWNAGPIFAPESMLSLTESEFLSRVQPVDGRGLTPDIEARSEQMLKELRTVKELVAAVLQAGRDAAATNNAVLARDHFPSLQRFGAALDHHNSLNILRLEGQEIKKKADAELNRNGTRPRPFRQIRPNQKPTHLDDKI